ncbi:hypothetical protein [Bizionia paragorgiae]|uniref:hypothetical protein n=1 Tax=Bizionia paragorgiae TaxID=283786 RepID=UPI003A955C35
MSIQNFGNKINTNGFDKRPENINQNGRPYSIKTDLKNILETDGTMEVKADQIVKKHKNGNITIQLPFTETIAIRLLDWAMSKKGNDSLKAIKMIMEQIDGKPDQKNTHSFDLENITGMTVT